jgi:hypothetical protein
MPPEKLHGFAPEGNQLDVALRAACPGPWAFFIPRLFASFTGRQVEMPRSRQAYHSRDQNFSDAPGGARQRVRPSPPFGAAV